MASRWPAEWNRGAYLVEGLSEKLSDDEIAQLASFLRGAWGNKGGEVTAAQVARQR